MFPDRFKIPIIGWGQVGENINMSGGGLEKWTPGSTGIIKNTKQRNKKRLCPLHRVRAAGVESAAAPGLPLKAKENSPYDSVVPLLGIHPREPEAYIILKPIQKHIIPLNTNMHYIKTYIQKSTSSVNTRAKLETTQVHTS